MIIDAELEISEQVIEAELSLEVGAPEEGGGYDKGYEEGVKAGKQAEYDAFWDAYQENGNRTDYRYAFGGTGWTDEIFEPKYPITVNGANTEAMFCYSSITQIPEGKLDFSKVNQCYMTFRGSKLIVAPTLDLSNCIYGVPMLFSQCINLKEIKTLTVSESVTFDNFVQNCTALEKITFAGTIGKSISFQWSNSLTAESVQSIIDHLKDLTGQTAQTITFHKDMASKVTPDQKQAIDAKNWTQVY